MKNKILFFEPETSDQLLGHHLDTMIETSIFLKNKKNEIIWFLNKKFNKNNYYIPKHINVQNVIETAKRKFLSIKTIFIIINISLKNLFYYIFFIFYFLLKGKIGSLIKAIASNYFTLPKYFPSFYFNYKNLNMLENDNIVIPSSRDNDIELFYFLYILEEKIPNLHFKILYPPKEKKIKNFFFYLRKISTLKEINNKFNFYSEVNYTKRIIKKKLNIKINNFNHAFSFSIKRYNKKNITIGFLGAATVEKGFVKLPDLIIKLQKKLKNLKFIIQITNINKTVEDAARKIINIAKKNKKIKIIYNYQDYKSYRNLLKKINIIPLMYEPGYFKKRGSGIFFSCITNEIPMVIPKNCSLWKNFLNKKYKNFEEAKNLNEFYKRIIYMSKNYRYFLNQAKKQSLNYKRILKKDIMMKRITS
jgi:hypothetical protein